MSTGQIIVAYAGSARPRARQNDVLYYVGGGRWNMAEVFNAPARVVAAGDVNQDGAVDLLIGGVDGTLSLLVNQVLASRPEGPALSTLSAERKQIAVRLLTVSLPAQKGTTHASL